jgi:hypothetical protein
MAILFYTSKAQMAVADNPMFPSEDEAAAIGLCCPESLPLQDWQTYFIKFYGDVPDSFPTEVGLYTQRRFNDQ